MKNKQLQKNPKRQQIFVNFPVFLLLLISSFILLWLEKVLGMILIFLSLLRLVLWPSMGSILKDVPCALEKNVYSAVVGQNIMYMSVESICSTV